MEIVKQVCHYCGAKPSGKKQHCHGREPFIYNGIDRKDNSIGYTKNNSLPCCSKCNFFKRDIPYSDFVGLIHSIVKFLGAA